MDTTNKCRCDAINRNGKRCCRRTFARVPTSVVYDARCNSYKYTPFRTVNLCTQHSILLDGLKKKNQRLKLHHRGWLGAYNQYSYGSLVIDCPTVDWKTAKVLRVPRFWAQRDND